MASTTRDWRKANDRLDQAEAALRAACQDSTDTQRELDSLALWMIDLGRAVDADPGNPGLRSQYADASRMERPLYARLAAAQRQVAQLEGEYEAAQRAYERIESYASTVGQDAAGAADTSRWTGDLPERRPGARVSVLLVVGLVLVIVVLSVISMAGHLHG
jgi:hypothetical protein